MITGLRIHQVSRRFLWPTYGAPGTLASALFFLFMCALRKTLHTGSRHCASVTHTRQLSGKKNVFCPLFLVIFPFPLAPFPAHTLPGCSSSGKGSGGEWL
ncbi:hypothetical protein, unlikely [Trypanosoma brucei gambiense DAL972]|uniref:Uncharacterized protein n=1 Tax=Trypanosoma brucei gambiense (strain MHOM/CI/86/DAL972) TaxID=679716 RepID=D0A427_TRYB9|nr:hypothetical protein, unlikely [Trypanosoma brucei gambiense DAL972]CBH16021.1 hypothetical protein, unlikely [Trypanosoma brucei gambiense DAL972]|eukprot:XP_011778285.1 hypothetical protein, unlikely [Trypanosoma brucei gambiense DAL972]